MSNKNVNQGKGGVGMSGLTHGLMLRQDVSAIAGAFPTELKKQTPPEAEQKWDDIENIYQELAVGIVEVGRNVNVMMTVPGIKENLTNPSEVKVLIEGLAKDLNMFADQAVVLHNRHAGKTGVICEHEFRESLEIFDQYVDLNTRFKAVTLPTVLSISDAVGEAVHNAKRKAEQAAQATTTEAPTA